MGWVVEIEGGPKFEFLGKKPPTPAQVREALNKSFQPVTSELGGDAGMTAPTVQDRPEQFDFDVRGRAVPAIKPEFGPPPDMPPQIELPTEAIPAQPVARPAEVVSPEMKPLPAWTQGAPEPTQPAFGPSAPAPVNAVLPRKVSVQPDVMLENAFAGVKQLMAGGAEGVANFSRHFATVFDGLDSVAKWLSDKTGLSRGGAFKKIATYLRGGEMGWRKLAKDIGGPEGTIIGDTIRALGSFPGDFASFLPYVSAIGPVAGFAVHGAIEGAREGGVTGAATGAAAGGLTGALFKLAHRLPKKISVPAFFGTMYASARGGGADHKDAMTHAIAMSIFVATGRTDLRNYEPLRQRIAEKTLEWGARTLEKTEARAIEKAVREKIQPAEVSRETPAAPPPQPEFIPGVKAGPGTVETVAPKTPVPGAEMPKPGAPVIVSGSPYSDMGPPEIPPWTRTRAQVRELVRKWQGTLSRKTIEPYYREHRKSVERALMEGKPVPPEVLKDYPDLAKTTAPEAPKPPTPKPVTGLDAELAKVRSRMDALKAEAQRLQAVAGEIRPGQKPTPEQIKAAQEIPRIKDALGEASAEWSRIRGEQRRAEQQAQPKAKQPWEMTRDEFVAKHPTTESIATPYFKHREAVERALTEGKTVAPEVLKDYPELIKPPTEPQYAKTRPEGISPEWEREAAPPDRPPDVSVYDAIRKVVKDLKLIYKQGGFKKDAVGMFKPLHDIIRTKGATFDQNVIAHELGHFVRKTLKIRDEDIPKDIRAELNRLGDAQGGGVDEGIAELVRLWATHPDIPNRTWTLAREEAPLATQWLEGLLKQAPAGLREPLETFKGQVGQYLIQDPRASARAMVKSRAEQKAIQENLGLQDRIKRKVAQAIWATTNKDYGFDRFKKFVEKDLRRPLSPGEDFRLATIVNRGVGGKIIEIMESGMIDIDRNVLLHKWHGDTLVKTNPGDPKGFGITPERIYAEIPKGRGKDASGYLIYRRAIARMEDTGLWLIKEPEAKVRETMRRWGADPSVAVPFKRMAAMVDALYDSLLSYAEQSGLINAEMKAKIQAENRSYVPFQRVFDEAVPEYGRGGSAGLVNFTNGIKKIRGSEREILDPLEQMVRDVYSTVVRADKNRILNLTGLWAEAIPRGGHFFERIEPEWKTTAVLREGEGGKPEPGFAKVETEPKGKDIIPVFREGKKIFYQVHDRPLLDAILGLEDQTAGFLFKVASVPVRLLRWGVTTHPAFAIQNFIRDNMQAAIFTSYGFALPGYRALVGLGHVLGKTDLYREWRRAGGAGVTRAMVGREFLNDSMKDVRKAAKGQLISRPSDLLQIMAKMSQAIEEATRVGEYRAGRKRGRTDIESAAAARDVTVDFARHGAQLRGLNLLTAFFNANIQGLSKLHRELNPFTSTRKGWEKTYPWIRASLLTAAATALWAANKDDPEIQAITAEEKGVYAFFRVPGLGLRRIALPHELGVLFFAIPYSIMDSTRGRTRESLYQTIIKQLGTGPFQAERMMPNMVKVPAELMLGKSLFWGRDIVPEYNRKKKGWEQVDPFTQKGTQWLAKKIFEITGGLVEPSAAKMEYAIRNLTGYMGSSFLRTFTAGLQQAGIIEGAPDWEAVGMDWAGIQRFIKEPYARSRYSQLFWEKYQRAESWYKTIKGYHDAGQGDLVTQTIDEVKKFDPDIYSWVARFPSLESARRSLSATYKLMRSIQMSDKTQREKQIMLLPLRRGLNNYYKNVLDIK